MATTGLSVDGLVSGLDTTSLITQLVSAEAITQTQLKTRLSATQDAASAYRSVNTKVDGLRAAAEELAKSSTWSAAKATSSSSGVAVALTGTPSTGSLAFTVDSVAAAHAVIGTARPSSTTAAAGYSSITVYGPDGTTAKGTITVAGNGSLSDAAAAINASSYGLTATVLQVSPDSYALQVNTKSTGSGSVFSLGSDFTKLRQGTDAKITIGEAVPPLQLTSSTNTFTGVLPGGTLTVSRVEKDVTIDVVADPDTVAAKVQSFVDAANAALSEIKTKSANGADSTAVLRGDSELRRLTDQVLDAVSSVVGTLGSPASAGLELTRDGTVKFTKDTFLTRLQADPDAVQSLFAGTAAVDGADGVATRLQALAKKTTNATTGTLTLLAKGRDDLAADLQTRISDWDLRLAARKDALTKQFTAMETALSSLKSQSSWLAGQLSSLS